MYLLSRKFTCTHVHLFLFITSFFFNDTATTEIYTLSLHDALPISGDKRHLELADYILQGDDRIKVPHRGYVYHFRSEEHTSELQSRLHLVCRLLLEKKKKSLDVRPLPASCRYRTTILSSTAIKFAF